MNKNSLEKSYIHKLPKRTLLFWQIVKLCMNLIATVIGFITSPFSAKKQIPWPDDTSIYDAPIEILVEKIKKGQLKSCDIVQAYINRINQINPIINSVVDLSKSALDEASKIDEEISKILNGSSDANFELLSKPLVGIPFSCKDSIAVDGMIQTAGSLFRKGFRSQIDSSVIKKLKQNGAIPLCITNTPEMLLWWESSNLLHGTTNNPYDLVRTAGGSSGGEAALVASCGSPVGIGSDMGGSIRIPACFCGIVGHKTTAHVVSTKGMWPFFPEGLNEFVSFGPLARKVCDAKLMLNCMIEDEFKDRLQLDKFIDLSTIKLMWMDDEGGNPLFSPIQSEILTMLDEVIISLEKKHSLQAKKLFFPEMIFNLDIWGTTIIKVDERKVVDIMYEASGIKVDPSIEILKSILGISNHSFNILCLATLQKYMMAHKSSETYQRDLKMFEKLKKKFLDNLGSNGVIICPTMPETAPKHKTTPFKGPDVSFCAVVNFLGLPSTHVPIRQARDGLPIGLQIISAPFNDNLCLAVATSIEEIFGGYKRP